MCLSRQPAMNITFCKLDSVSLSRRTQHRFPPSLVAVRITSKTPNFRGTGKIGPAKGSSIVQQSRTFGLSPSTVRKYVVE